MSSPQERARAALQANVHLAKSDVDAIRDQVVSDVVNKRRGMSLESAMKSSPRIGISPLALYTATQAGAIGAKKDAGELSPGGILRACAPVVDQLAKADLDESDLNSDPDLAEAVKELHNLLSQASGDDSGKTAKKSAGDPAPTERDPFGNAVTKAEGTNRGPSGEALSDPAGVVRDAFGNPMHETGDQLAEKSRSVEQMLAEDTSDDEDADDGGMIAQSWRQVGKSRDMFGNH